MKIGLILSAKNPSGEVDLALRAERAGFSSVHTVDFFQRNALVRLAAIAQATSTIEIGSGIANTFTRSPMVLGSAALDIDELSGGRLVLGLGTGLQRMNEEWYDVPFGKPVTRARELIALLRKLFAHQGVGFEYEGPSYSIRIPAYRRAHVERPEIPIRLAAVNPGMTRLAGEVAEGMVGHPVHTRRWHREVTLPTLREAEAAAGRPPGSCSLNPYLICAVRESREEALAVAKRQIGFSFSVEHYHTILRLHGLEEVGRRCRAALPTFDLAAMAEAVPDELVDEIAIACPPDEVADRLKLWEELTDEVLLYPASAEFSGQETDMDALFELFGTLASDAS